MNFVIVFFGWIFSLCLHEFSHALAQYQDRWAPGHPQPLQTSTPHAAKNDRQQLLQHIHQLNTLNHEQAVSAARTPDGQLTIPTRRPDQWIGRR